MKENPNDLSAFPLIGSLLDCDEFSKCGEVLDGHSIVRLWRRMIVHVLCRTAAGVKAEVFVYDSDGENANKAPAEDEIDKTKPRIK